LLRPQANPCQNPFVAPDKFSKKSPMPLWVNFSRENFHSWYPCFFDLASVLVGGHEFAHIHASLRQLLREGSRAIITRRECVFSSQINPLPKILFARGHVP